MGDDLKQYIPDHYEDPRATWRPPSASSSDSAVTEHHL